jgi:tetratricopeptide (TPR) repeat protein
VLIGCDARPGGAAAGWVPDPSRAWLVAAPCNGTGRYALALDVADAALALDAGPLVRAAAAAIAPRWEEVEPLLHAAGPVGPGWHDIQREDEELTEQFLLGSLARAVAQLGPGVGVWLDEPRRHGRAGRYFVRRLAAEARRTDLAIAFTCGEAQDWPARIERFVCAPRPTPSRRGAPTATEVLLAVATHGAPVEALLAAGADGAELEALACPPPAGRRWAALAPQRAAAVLERVGEAERRAACTALYEAWAPHGWDYLRRASLAVDGGRAELLLGDHRAVLHGSLATGREHLLERYEAMVRSQGPLLEPFRQASLLSAARLVERRGGEHDVETATRWLGEALAMESRPASRAALLYELANRHALQRTPASLAEARRDYTTGFAMLDEIADAEQRLRSEIVFLNGLALVEYLEHRAEQALALERRALELADAARERWPEVARWARPLLHTNTAKLLDRRLADRPGAIAHLRQAVRLARDEHVPHLTVELARMRFDEAQDAEVVALLAPFFGDAASVTTDEREELLARAMLAVALVRLGRGREAAEQLGALRRLGAAGAHEEPPALQGQLEALLAAAA